MKKADRRRVFPDEYELKSGKFADGTPLTDARRAYLKREREAWLAREGEIEKAKARCQKPLSKRLRRVALSLAREWIADIDDPDADTWALIVVCRSLIEREAEAAGKTRQRRKRSK